MVTFCVRCGGSLPPFATTLIKEGKEIPSPHFICPSCGESAGVKKEEKEDSGIIGDKDIIIKDGKVEEKR